MRLPTITTILALICTALPSSPSVAAQGNDVPGPDWTFTEARQFDFWLGEWEVTNRFFREGRGWVENGVSHAKIYSILDGKGILEYWNGDQINGRDIRGFSLRYFDVDAGRWILALNWPGPDSPSFGQLEGSFRHGRGEFIAEGADAEGNRSMTRYTFSDIGPTSLRWDDGVSTDGGRTWRGSWIMEFSRTAEQAAWPSLDEPFHTFHGQVRCTRPEARQLDGTVGRWSGTWRGVDGSESPVTLESREVLDGCGVMQLWSRGSDASAIDRFTLASFVPRFEGWLVLELDDRPGTGYRYLSGGETDGEWSVTDTRYARYRPGAGGGPLRRMAWRSITAVALTLEWLESNDDGESWNVVATVRLTPDGA